MPVFDPIGLTAALTQEAEMLRAAAEAPAAVLRIEIGNLVIASASGVSDLETGRPAGPAQTFEVGSQAKMMTAVVILQLVEQGLIDLDARAAVYLPAEVTAGLPNADVATVRQLLNMRSGIPNYTEAVDPDGLPLFLLSLVDNPDQVFGPDQALEIARGMPATGEPGGSEYYSNTNYTLLGRMIEDLTGGSYFDALQQRIFDPAGKTDTVRQLANGDDRLESYAVNPLSGQTVNVTLAPWEPRGEAGVVSTTADMSAFLRALLVDRTLLGPAALAEMTAFQLSESIPGASSSFGLGLVEIVVDGGNTYVGFTGGTIATESSTYLEVQTGAIVSLGGTSETFASTGGALSLLQGVAARPAWKPVADDGSPLVFVSGSAADLTLAPSPDGLTFALAGASLTLPRVLDRLTTQSVTFSDGSVLHVGDDRSLGRGDARGNDIDILRDHGGAAGADNQILGLQGDDRLRGGHGGDRIDGGDGSDRIDGRSGDDRLHGGDGSDRIDGRSGDDRLHGGDGGDRIAGGDGADRLWGDAGNDAVWGDAGDDTMWGGAGKDVLRGGAGNDVLAGGEGYDILFGGDGDDLLIGGAGRDNLTGGAGSDTFAFLAVWDAPGPRGRDAILDFGTGEDRIDLSALRDAPDDALIWLADAAFDGAAGQLRYTSREDGVFVQADLTGDGSADFSFSVDGIQSLAATDFLL